MQVAPATVVNCRYSWPAIALPRLAAMWAVAVLCLAQIPAAAQMQIPNPLIRPRSLTNPGTKAAPPAGDMSQQRPAAPGSGNAAISLNGAPSNTPEDIYTRSVNELKDRFATFYVSAIVGKDAILRRSAGGARAALPSANGAASGGSSSNGGVAPAISLSGTTPTNATPVRSDTLMVSDGELLDSVGNSGALVAKVHSRQVTIYYVQETMALPGGKLVGKRAVVFAGDVENSGNSGSPTIVLERSDPTYTRRISVESKVRSASSNQDSSSSNNGSSTNNNSNSNSQVPQ